MQIIIQWIVDNWQLVASVLLFVLSFILQLIKKKPTQVIDGVREDIFKWCVAAVSFVENSGIKGSSEKLDAAIKYVYQNFLDKYYPHEDNAQSFFYIQYSEMARRYIEAILSTPQKHEK